MNALWSRPRPATKPVVDEPTAGPGQAPAPGNAPRPAQPGDPTGAPQRQWSRLRCWSGAHPLLLDAALAALLDIWVWLSFAHQGTTGWWPLLLSQLLVAPLLIRRRAPWLVFWLLVTVATIQWASGVRFVADAALLIALYTVAAYRPRRHALIAAGVLEIGVLLASIRFAPTNDGVIASIIFLSGLVAAALFSGITVQNRRDYLASLVERAAHLERERDQQILLAATTERARIAREMHDIIAHSLSVIITLADGAALTNPHAPEEATEAMLQVASLGRTSMGEMRRLLGVLRDDTAPHAGPAPQPGLQRLDTLITDMRAAGLPAQLAVRGVPRPLPPTTASAAYRIVQESLTNVLKHAHQPTRVRVEIGWRPDTIHITVSDDGAATGPPPAPDTGKPGHGLVGMRERAALFGGTFTAGPATAHGGWRTEATLPLDPV